MDKKAQGAMEYLMTYGWAILVVIIVGIVLWQSGIFGTGGGGVSGFSEVRVEDYVFNADGFNASYENAAGQTLRNVNITYTLDNGTDVASDFWDGASGSWAPGKENADGFADTVTCLTTGAGYTLDVTVVYTTEAGLSHTEAGTIRGTCD